MNALLRFASVRPITFTYRNWRGEVAERIASPTGLWFGASDHHPRPQWLMDAMDLERKAVRSFAVADMSSVNPAGIRVTVPVPGRVTVTRPARLAFEGGQAIRFRYTDWQGITGHKEVEAEAVWWGTTNYYPDAQWLLSGWDRSRNVPRDFALANAEQVGFLPVSQSA
jgi:predicted DNA-binding transcriptional regulator YafY